jgi:hypothetical protein
MAIVYVHPSFRPWLHTDLPGEHGVQSTTRYPVQVGKLTDAVVGREKLFLFHISAGAGKFNPNEI